MSPKILFTGTPGAGKTTAIAAISDFSPVVTEVKNTDSLVRKAWTTAGLDFGQVDLGDGICVRLYGTPGQSRFEQTWHILARGAMGVVILVDNSSANPLVDLAMYLDAFQTSGDQKVGFAVGVGRTECHPDPALDEYARFMFERGLVTPVFAVDVRRRDDVLLLIDAILAQAEVLALAPTEA